MTLVGLSVYSTASAAPSAIINYGLPNNANIALVPFPDCFVDQTTGYKNVMLARIKFCNFRFSKWQREVLLARINGAAVRFRLDSVAVTSLEDIIYMLSYYCIVSEIALLDSNNAQSISYFCSWLFPRILDLKNDFVVVLLQVFWNDNISRRKPRSLLRLERLVGFYECFPLKIGHQGQNKGKNWNTIANAQNSNNFTKSFLAPVQRLCPIIHQFLTGVGLCIYAFGECWIVVVIRQGKPLSAIFGVAVCISGALL
jgi:hypothetical protein